MAFQSNAFQSNAFQQSVTEPPTPEPALTPGGIVATILPDRLRTFGELIIPIRVSGVASIHLDEADLRRRVRDHLSALLG